MSQKSYRDRLRRRSNTPVGGGINPTFTPGVARVTTAQQDQMAGKSPPPPAPEPIQPEEAGNVPPVTAGPQQTTQEVQTEVTKAEEAIAQAAQDPAKPELPPGTELDRSVETNRPVAEVDAEEAAPTPVVEAPPAPVQEQYPEPDFDPTPEEPVDMGSKVDDEPKGS